jgi:hypothetical protein
MIRKLGFLVVALGLVLPVYAAGKPATISGYVRSSGGVPQMGAMVEVLGSALQSLTVFTNEKGFYAAPGLAPGNYAVKVSAPSFLPALREGVGLRSGASAVVNLTLNTLFEAIQLAPAAQRPAEQDDWKWVLRSSANRPILRVLPDGTTVLASTESKDSHDLKGTLSFVAGAPVDGYGSASDMSTGFSVEKSMFSAGTLGFSGSVGYGSGSPEGIMRASYRHRMENGSEPEVALTIRQLAPPDANLRDAALQAISLTTGSNFAVSDVLELHFGTELQTIQFMGRVSAFRPFGSADLHLSPDTVLEYSYATSEPDQRLEKGYESAPADLSESGPRVSIAGFSPSLERAHHQEVSLSRRMGKTNMQFAVYSDRVVDPALTGIGDVGPSDGNVLPDLYSQSFTYRGQNLDARGLRVVLQRKLTSDLTATMDYDFGGVLDVAGDDLTLNQARHGMVMRNRHALAGKLSGKLPDANTRWIVSYRWINGEALTPVDMFNASAGQTDPYLSLYFRQPIPGMGFFPCRVEALVDVRNLLAQGYVPVRGEDGHTVYLVQSARSVRGGVAFVF